MRVKTEARREAILAVASQVFLETGYERASMSAISSRVGGSKGTLYSYFVSKEALFVEVTLAAARNHLERIFSVLKPGMRDLRGGLCRFGERYMGVLAQPYFLNARRTVIAESGHSDIGRRFYEAGPQTGEHRLCSFIDAEMQAGRLRPGQPSVATKHLIALICAESIDDLLLGRKTTLSKAEIRRSVARGVDVFLAAYGSECPVTPAADCAPETPAGASTDTPA